MRPLLSGPFLLLIAGLLILSPLDPGAARAAEAVVEEARRVQLQRIAEAYELEIQGLDKVDDQSVPVVKDTLVGRLEILLSGYNFVLTYDDENTPRILRIIGERPLLRRSRPSRHIVRARSLGAHLIVEAKVTGPGGKLRLLPLMVDTGASAVVLPRSLLEPLGFKARELPDGWSNTANGRVRTKIGTLMALQIGYAVEHQVRVIFIDDDSLAGGGLLGMSFLGRFRFTLDDSQQQLILMAR